MSVTYNLLEAKLKCNRCGKEYKSKTLTAYCSKECRTIKNRKSYEFKCKQCNKIFDYYTPRIICNECLDTKKIRIRKMKQMLEDGISAKEVASKLNYSIGYVKSRAHWIYYLKLKREMNANRS